MKLIYRISVFLLPLLALCACDEEEIGKKPQPLPDGVMRLSATVSNGVKTRALNDPLSDATVDEKRVDRIAFFVYTEAEGMQVYVPATAAETYDDYPNKVHLTDNPDGTYEAKVDLTAGAGYEADVIAVANLPEDYDYTQIVSWKGLIDSVTVATTTMPLCIGTDAGGKNNAFIMFASATVALRKEKEAAVSFAMERLVARIDITNKAYGTGTNAFKLTKARILQAKPASYITPHDLYASPEVVTVNNWQLDPTAIKFYKGEVTDANETTEGANDATCQAAWHTLYTYENDDVAHTPTSLEVTGEMNGATITRKIPFEVTDADGITKKPVPIVRNHRYLVQINPAPGETDITYKLTVDEWNAVDTVNVQPNQNQVPVMSNYSCAEATKTFGTFNASTGIPDTIVVPATGGTIDFIASCPFDSRVIVDYASVADGNDWLEITDRSDAVVTKAGSSLARTYKITVKADLALDPTQVNRGYLYIVNGGNGSVMDTVTVYQGADIAYADTRFAAVTAYGVVWAPYNSGATEVTGKDETITVWTLEKCGYLYQWGRNVPFVYGGESSDLYTGDLSALNKYPDYNDACKNEGVYADKFIKGFAGADNTWFKDYKTGGVTVGDNAWLRENQPCPAGWRLPTKAELDKILVDNPRVSDGKWISPSYANFILIAGGYRGYQGASGKAAIEANFWSSSFAAGAASRLLFSSSSASVDSLAPSYGFFVRCVKE
nr:FISUMP domain-containing protein [Parabacteroides goldsteinii]